MKPFDYGRNNHVVTLPHWQEQFRDGSIPSSFIAERGGARYARNMPANFALPNSKPALAHANNFAGCRMPLTVDNSYASTEWRWRGPQQYADQISAPNWSVAYHPIGYNE